MVIDVQLGREMKRNEQERDAFLKKYRTVTLDGYPTFDLERYYNDMDLAELTQLRDRTAASLKKYPDFGTEFYTQFLEYLNRKIYERTN